MSQITILDGSTFCVSGPTGDVGFETDGLFAEDTRYLSLLRLTVNSERPLLLSHGRVEYFSAAFFMRNPMHVGLPQDSLSILRERFVGDAMQDRVTIENLSTEPLTFEVGLELGADFADIITVKEHDFSFGRPVGARPLPALVEPVFDPRVNGFLLRDPAGAPATQVLLSQSGDVEGGRVRFRVTLRPRERWELDLDVVPSPSGVPMPERLAHHHFGEEKARVRDSLSAWQVRVPQLRGTWVDLVRAFDQSVADLASLRMRGANGGVGRLPAAGMPWFMTVFGRDTIITCLQTLLFGPELAVAALDALAELQATEDDPDVDAEPGKIVHELRRGKAVESWFGTYYGSVDATPLFLVLLSETWRWTDDLQLVQRMRGPALAALEWIDRYGDRDGDGFVEYERRTPRGLENQSWKDSHDSQRFRDGRRAQTPIAPCEVQGYVYDAKRRMAELAREAWRDRELARRLERDAEELRQRFDEAFWIDDRGGYYALALDGDKQRVDALCSNVGHLLWSGIVPPHRVDAIADRLMGDELWSGWGIRTMSSGDLPYNPISYHNGTVWPHDNSLIAWGLARYNRWPEAQRIVRRLIEAAGHFGYQLPEVFAGIARTETPFPIAYPTASRPQAWAAGAPVLLLQILLGVQPDRERQLLESVAPLELPYWAGSLRLNGIRAFDRAWDLRVEEGAVRIEEA